MGGNIEAAYRIAGERYAGLGVDVEAALAQMARIPLSLHCWQGDDVAGFEIKDGGVSGGIQSTGNHPGKARNIAQLREDIAFVKRQLPGPLKLNLHASYIDCPHKVERNAIAPEHFFGWVDWARAHDFGLDFNGTFFDHPKSALTLTSPDEAVRAYWIEHAVASRRIGEYFGRELGKRCCLNLWIPDGSKDTPADLAAPRARLLDSLDKIFAHKVERAHLFEGVECKLFGIGSESYVAGSHEFYLAYAVKNGLGLTLDTGHFHPTESVADKISSVLFFVEGIILHLSRGVRWDSDHVLTLSDETLAIGREVARNHARVNVGLDFFDASINRIAAWVIGARNAQKAILSGLLTPFAALAEAEGAGNLARRLALYEEVRTLPLGAVWDMYCERLGVAPGLEWLEGVEAYEREVLLRR